VNVKNARYKLSFANHRQYITDEAERMVLRLKHRIDKAYHNLDPQCADGSIETSNTDGTRCALLCARSTSTRSRSVKT